MDGVPTRATLRHLREGINLEDGPTAPARAALVGDAQGSVALLRLTIHEGRNRQVRRMTAAVGLPTLRLIRYSVGEWTVDGLASGSWIELG